MELSSTFSHAGWSIRYGVFEPELETRLHLKTVVFVHGTPWSSVVFQPLAKALLASKRYRIVLYDLPGYGTSQQHESTSSKQSEDALELFKTDLRQDTSVKAQGAALAALLQHLRLDGQNGNTSPAIVAHDIAGTIVLRTHLLHHCNFASMMLLETNTILPWGDGFYQLARSRPEAFVEMPPTIFESVVRAVVRSAGHVPESLPKQWEDALTKPWISHAKNQRSFMRQIAQANDQDVQEMLDQDLYGKVRCDVKIVWGESDAWIPKAKLEKFAGMLGERCKEFVTVPEAGHLVMIDQPERVAVETLEWLGKY